MMLLVSRTISTLSQFTCIMPMSTGEIQQGKIQRTVVCFHMTSFMENRFTNFTENYQEPSMYYRSGAPKFSVYFPVYFLCLNAIFSFGKGNYNPVVTFPPPHPRSCKVFLPFLSTVFQDEECH